MKKKQNKTAVDLLTINKSWDRSYLNLPLYLLGWKIWWPCALFHGAPHWDRKSTEIWGDTRGGGGVACFPQTTQGQYSTLTLPMGKYIFFLPCLSALICSGEVRVQGLLYSIKLGPIRTQYFQGSSAGWIFELRLEPRVRVLTSNCKLPKWLDKKKKKEWIECYLNAKIVALPWEYVVIDIFIFSLKGINECLADSGSGVTEHSLSGWGDLGLLSSRLHNHHKILDQCHQNPLWGGTSLRF